MRASSSTESLPYGQRQTECLNAAERTGGSDRTVPVPTRAAAPAPTPVARNRRRFIAMVSEISALELTHGVIGRARGERHVRDRWILAGRARHAGAIGYVDVRRVVQLVVGVERGGLRIASHARRPHLVDAEPGLRTETAGLVRVPAVHVANARRFQHLAGLLLHVLRHRHLVLRPLAADSQQRDAPLVGLL